MLIKYNVASNWYYKYLSDIIYAWEMERMGTSAYATWSRFIGLTIVIGLTFTPYRYVITGLRMNKTQKQTMKEIYKMFK